MKKLSRFLHDYRVETKVVKFERRHGFDCNIEYRIIATWEKSEEVTNLALAALDEAYEYVNIIVSRKDLAGRLDFDVSKVILDELNI